LNLQGGKLQSQLRSDFFTGKTIEKERILYDTQYSRNSFYRIYGTERSIAREADTIFVDDGSSATNTIGTQEGYTIGGITGDFDMLVHSIDYFIDYSRAVIHFLTSRSNADVIVLKIGNENIIIQSDIVRDHVLENTYFIGPDIIPVSFDMAIVDTLGQGYPLSDFGLDENGDGRVDPEFINYDLGYLSFPDDRPFPDIVYDSLVNVYAMQWSFNSPSVFYYLSGTPVFIGSEKVFMDGELLNRGTHYIVDYTSGVLLFLQKDVVSDYSEIEVQYATIEHNRDELMYSIQPIVEVGDGMHIAPGFSRVDEEQIGHLSGRIEYGERGEREIKIIPQVAVTRSKEWAQKYALLATYGIFSMHSSYHRMSDGFEPFGAHEKKYGRLAQDLSVLAAIEPGAFIKVEGRYKKEEQIESEGIRSDVTYTHGKLNYLNPRLPNGYLLLANDRFPEYGKQRMQLNANYDFQMFYSDIKLHSILRNDNVVLSDNTSNRTLEYIINTNVVFPFPVSGNIAVRRNSFSTEQRERLEDELRGIVNIDVIPGLFYTGNYNLRSTSYFIESSQDLKLTQYFYNNLNIAPGRWYSQLSIVNFSAGISSNFEEYIGNLSTSYRKPVLVLYPLKSGTPSSVNDMRNYYAGMQLTPVSQIVVWGKRTLTKSGNSYYSVPRLIPITRDELRIEYERVHLGYFMASYERKNIQSYPIQTDQNLYFEWNKPWAAFLRTKVTTNYHIDEDDYAVGVLSTEELKGNLETLLRFGTKSYVRFYVGGTKWTDQLNETGYAVVPGAGLNINLFTFLYVQFDYESTHIIDGITTHTLLSRITGQF
jgi:hypothetical protein